MFAILLLSFELFVASMPQKITTKRKFSFCGYGIQGFNHLEDFVDYSRDFN